MRNGQNIYGLGQLGDLDVLYIGQDAKIDLPPAVRSCEVFAIDESAQNRGGGFNKILLNLKIFGAGYYPQFAGHYLRSVVEWINRREADGVVYDYIVVEELALAYYIPYLKRIGRTVVFDAHNVEGLLRNQMEAVGIGFARFVGFGALKRYVLRKNLERLERKAVNNSDMVWACSDLDRNLLGEIYGAHIKCFVVPNAINVDNYVYADRELETASWSDKPLTVVYMGTYSYRPNSDAAMTLMAEIMPILRSQGRQVKLNLVGRSPTPAMIAYAKQYPDIVITGSVDSIEPYLKMACVLAMPIALGSGTRLKVLEGLAARRPIVSTSKGAEGLEMENEVNILIQEEPAGIASAIVSLWENVEMRKKICERGYGLVKERYSWNSAAQCIADSLNIRIENN